MRRIIIRPLLRQANASRRLKRRQPTGVMKMNRGGQQMTMKYTGKRLGDCDKK